MRTRLHAASRRFHRRARAMRRPHTRGGRSARCTRSSSCATASRAPSSQTRSLATACRWAPRQRPRVPNSRSDRPSSGNAPQPSNRRARARLGARNPGRARTRPRAPARANARHRRTLPGEPSRRHRAGHRARRLRVVSLRARARARRCSLRSARGEEGGGGTPHRACCVRCRFYVSIDRGMAPLARAAPTAHAPAALPAGAPRQPHGALRAASAAAARRSTSPPRLVPRGGAAAAAPLLSTARGWPLASRPSDVPSPSAAGAPSRADCAMECARLPSASITCAHGACAVATRQGDGDGDGGEGG